MDLKIACTTLAHGGTLLTRNTVDFCKVPDSDLEVISYPGGGLGL